MNFTHSASKNIISLSQRCKLKYLVVIGLLACAMLSGCNSATPIPLETNIPVTATQTPVPLDFTGIMPNTGSEFQPSALSPIQAAINALNYRVVYADGNVGKIANQTCISVVPEKMRDASGAAETLISKELTNGVAKYSGGMQVLAEVPLPPNTDTDTYTCAMTYDKSNSVLYQTLVHTDVVTGEVEVLASIPVAYSKDDSVEIVNNTIKVNGENVNWTYIAGKEPLATQVEIQKQFESVLTDPWKATEVQKTEFDNYITNRWHQTLKNAGVENAENLTEYDLLEAIINYEQTQPVDANRVVYLPFSLHKLVRTDINNIIPYHIKEDSGLGYGIGQNISPPPTIDTLQSFITYNPDFTFYGEIIRSNSTQFAVSGDLVMLFNTPGFTPDKAVGAVIKMYGEDGTTHYTEIFIPLTQLSVHEGDMCLKGAYATPCSAGKEMQRSIIRSSYGRKDNTLDYLLKLIKLNNAIHVETTPDGSTPVWSDGSEIVFALTIPDLPENFFERN